VTRSRRVLFVAAATVLCLAVVYGILLLVVHLSNPTARLKSAIQDGVRAQTGKSIKLTSVGFDAFFNLRLDEVIISTSSDFNDPGSYISAESVTAELSFFSLLHGPLRLKTLRVRNLKATLPVRTDNTTGLRGLKELFQQTLRLMESTDISGVTLDGGTVAVPYASDAERKITFGRIHLALNRRSDRITLAAGTRVKETAAVAAIDAVYFTKPFAASRLRIELRSFDASFIRLLAGFSDIECAGFLNAEILREEINGDSRISVEGDIEQASIKGTVGGVRLAHSGETITVSWKSGSTCGHDTVAASLRSASGLFVTVDGMMTPADTAIGRMEVRCDNLAPLTSRSTLPSAMNAAGELRFNASGAVSLRAGILHVGDYALGLAKGSASLIRGGERVTVMESLSATVHGTEGSIRLDARGETERHRSIFSVSGFSSVSSYAPFSADSSLVIASPRLDIRDALAVIGPMADSLMGRARDDLRLGYDESFFRQKPIGVVLNANTLRARFGADELCIAGKAKLSGVALSLGLNRGMLHGELSAGGVYGGSLSGTVDSFLNSDYPSIKASAAVAGADFAAFWKDAGFGGAFSDSVFGASLNYECSGYRVSHLIENRKMSLALDLRAAAVEGTDQQTRMATILRKMGTESDIRTLQNISAGINYDLYGQTAICSRFFVSSPVFSVSGYGRSDDGALSVPLAVRAAVDGGLMRENRISFSFPDADWAMRIRYQAAGREETVVFN
jgi:hypothetical protein